METIYGFEPTQQELDEIGIDNISLILSHGVNIADPIEPEAYRQLVSQEGAYFHLALFFECRSNKRRANFYWRKIPRKHEEYLRGFDDVLEE
jgi:hypothetical protein